MYLLESSGSFREGEHKEIVRGYMGVSDRVSFTNYFSGTDCFLERGVKSIRGTWPKVTLMI